MLTDILRNMTLFVDGTRYAGVVEEVTLPKLQVKTEEHRAGGLDAPIEIDMGMEKIEAGLKLSNVAAGLLSQWGLLGTLTPLTMRGALVSEDGSVKAAICTIRGLLREVDPGEWKAGEKATLSAMVACRYYKLEIGGETVHEIDVENMIRIVGGVDQLAAQREALGI